MIGADDEDDQADPESANYEDLDLDFLERHAEGDSVTADRLRGFEQYFPDCRPFLQDDQQPHHMILLTMSGWAFRAEGTVHRESHLESNASTHTDMEASSGGVAICFEDELLVVVDGAICAIPYDRIQAIISGLSLIEIQTAGSKSYLLDVAKSANKTFVFEAVAYLRRRIRSSG